MKKHLEMIAFARNSLAKIVEELTTEQANEIPNGYNNNIIWHFGHVIASQQGVCYLRSGNAPILDVAIIEKYKNGTKPDHFITEDEITFLKNISAETLEQLEKDIDARLLNTYTPFTLSNGIEVGSIEDALVMLTFHEGLHLGHAQAMKRLIKP